LGVSEVKFLSSRITPGSALLDLGANAGLISRQIQLVCPTPHFSILVEPIPINQEFITRNLVNFNYELLPFALGAISGKQKFFVRSSNIGNSSLKVENLNGDYTEMEVEVRDTSIIDQCLGRRQIGDLFLKSDLEGMDSQILARLSDNIWSRIQSGVIEVWPRVLDNHGDVDLLCAQLSKFKWMSWTPTGDSMLSIRELSDYWTRPSNPMATLYFSRF
jgi:FkbM family methyltransferase